MGSFVRSRCVPDRPWDPPGVPPFRGRAGKEHQRAAIQEVRIGDDGALAPLVVEDDLAADRPEVDPAEPESLRVSDHGVTGLVVRDGLPRRSVHAAPCFLPRCSMTMT